MKNLKNVLFLLLILFMVCKGHAKPRTVYLDKELKGAMYFDYVEVLNYTDSTIIFKEIDGFQSYNSNDWFDSDNFKLSARNDTVLYAAKLKGGLNDLDVKKYTTGYLPKKGEKILIVINKENQVSLFANLEDGTYRFWSPYYTGSSALFCFNEPATKLKEKNGLTEKLGDYETCWDGCLLSSNELLSYGYKNEIKTFKGTAQMNGGRALFICEFAYSEPYFLNGIENWEEKYLDKTITVKGILVQFVEGKSMILNWEILKTE
jgi:hypothetical protein